MIAIASDYIIGLDVGTTAAKACAFEVGENRDASTVRALREYPLRQPHPGHQIQDPVLIIDSAAAAVAECVSVLGSGRAVGIALSSALHGLIGLGPDYRPSTPLLTWADSRSAEQATRLHRDGAARSLHETSGTPIHSMTPLTKLMWFAEHGDLSSSTRHWIGLKDWVIHNLTGHLVTELSSASATGLLDVSTRAWNPDALALAGIDESQLPEIRSTTDHLGLTPTMAERLGLPAGLPVVLGAGDGPLGNLGTQAMLPGVAGLSVGTSGALRSIVTQPRVIGGGSLFCYALTEDLWVRGGAVSNGGIVIRWAGDVFGQDFHRSGSAPPDAEMLKLAESVPAGSEGLVMLPYLLAERAPLWDPELPGAFLGVRRRHTRAHFVRAAIEGVATQLALILRDMDRLEAVSSIRATGGAFRSTLWQRILTDALDRPVTVTGGADGSALGAAALGLVGLGRAPDPLAAMAQLPSGADADATLPAPEQAAVYAQVRGDTAALIRQLAPLADAFAPKS